MTRQEILDAIPHRDPFLLVDEIVERSDTRIVGSKVFGGGEWFFAGHYPGHPLVPGVLLCNRRIDAEHPRLMDIGPTVLDLFGVEVPSYMDGKPLAVADADEGDESQPPEEE